MQINKKSAMTLAEVLMVLVIIGTVSALTVPGLKKYSQRSEYAKLAQKGYNTLQGAFDLAVANEEKDPDDWTSPNVASFLLRDYFGKYINKAEDCSASYGSSNSCFKGITPYSGGNAQKPNVRSIVLPDGISISASGNNSGGVAMNSFIIDVNGPNEPNREGVDIFIFNYGKYNANCSATASDGQWKFCPANNHTRQLMEDGWRITYW
ncbi:MAG: type II secretion system protein [Clostridium sp.]|nr:type II secretion system protein [Clostridium sp.]